MDAEVVLIIVAKLSVISKLRNITVFYKLYSIYLSASAGSEVPYDDRCKVLHRIDNKISVRY